MKKKELLFVSIAFPPKLDPECIQTARYYKYLRKLGTGYRIRVVTSDLPTRFMPYDESLADCPIPEQEIRIRLFEPRWPHALLSRLIPGLLQLPDSKYSFHLQWRQVIASLQVKPDIIYSRSFPLSSALMAMKLQRYYQVPWVMHLSDPWAESPLHRLKGYAKRMNERWEQACFKAASYIGLTSEKTIELYRKKYPQWNHKLILMPNVFDPGNTAIGTSGESASGLVRFVYTGGLANTRSAAPLLQAISRLNAENPELATSTEFVFAGDMDARNKKLFRQYALPNVQHLGPVSYRKANELQHSAHVLIALDSPITNQEQALFFPSKLLDYWAAGKPILAITSPESTTGEFIKSNNLGAVAYLSDTEMLLEQIKWFAEAFLDKNSDGLQTPPPAEKFAADHNAGVLIGLLDQLVKS